MKWYDVVGNESDIVISTRLRLARNISGYAFPSRLDDKKAEEIVAKVYDNLSALGSSFQKIDFHSLGEAERGAYVERHVASKEFANETIPRALLLSEDESISIMVNEEDHLRIQLMGAGQCIDECMEKAYKIDMLMDEKLHYAFDEKLGYLTACPTNLGCGIRISVMLHLPTLTESGNIGSIIAQAGKLGFAVRGIYGEGTQAEGAVYQISNALSLGRTEEETAARLKDVTMSIIETERRLRTKIYEANRDYIEDRVYRAEAILRNARIMTSDEAIRLLSDLRMGLGTINNIGAETVDRLMWEIRPYNVMLSIGKDGAKPLSRDTARAKLIRESLEHIGK